VEPPVSRHGADLASLPAARLLRRKGFEQHPPMNFLYRSAAQPAAPELPRIPEDASPKPATTLEGLIIAEDSYQPPSARGEDGAASNGPGDAGAGSGSLDSKGPVLPGTHTDVAEDEGWITIPYSWVPSACLSHFVSEMHCLHLSSV